MRAVGYARISKDDTHEGRGVERQCQDIEALCERRGWELVTIFVDNDVSASRYSRKPRHGYNQVIGMVEDGLVDRLVIYNQDRLFRISDQLEHLIDLANTLDDFQVESVVTGQLDLTTPAGRANARIQLTMAQYEVETQSVRIRRALEQRVQEGKPHGPRPFGYEPDGVTIRESEAALIRQAVVDVLDGVSLNAVARRWNDEGVKPPQRATLWSGPTVKSVLLSVRNTGKLMFRGEVVKSDAFPAIVDDLTHRRLKHRFEQSGERTPPNRTPFTGLIVGPNGVPLDRLSKRTPSGRRVIYSGRKRPGREADPIQISAEPLEVFITEALFTALDDDTLAVRVAARTSTKPPKVPDLDSIEERLRTLAEMYGNGEISEAEWLAARRPLQEHQKAAHAALDAEARKRRIPTLVDSDLRKAWPGLGVDRKRQILRAFFECVVIRPATTRGGPQPFVAGLGRIDLDRVELRWRY